MFFKFLETQILAAKCRLSFAIVTVLMLTSSTKGRVSQGCIMVTEGLLSDGHQLG